MVFSREDILYNKCLFPVGNYKTLKTGSLFCFKEVIMEVRLTNIVLRRTDSPGRTRRWCWIPLRVSQFHWRHRSPQVPLGIPGRVRDVFLHVEEPAPHSDPAAGWREPSPLPGPPLWTAWRASVPPRPARVWCGRRLPLSGHRGGWSSSCSHRFSLTDWTLQSGSSYSWVLTCPVAVGQPANGSTLSR